MSAFKYFTKVDIVVGMQSQKSEVKTTKVQACMALVCASTDDSRPLTGSTNMSTVVDGG